MTRPGGYVGLAEATLLKAPPPPALVAWASQDIGAPVELLTAPEWVGLLEGAGLREVQSKTYGIDMRSESRALAQRYGCSRYGLAIVTGNMAVVLVVGLAWVWEAIAERNDFSQRRRWLQVWWVAPLAAVALLAPVDATTMTPDFRALGVLSNGAGLTFCMMTPVVLAVLTMHYPSVNTVVLRVSSFVGLLLGVINLIMWFVLQPWGWWMGVMHIPLVALSVYGLVLGLRATALPGTAAQ